MSTTPHDVDEKPAFTLDFPPVFGYEGLSILLGRTVASLQRDRHRKPWTLPPACTPPGTKSPRWLLTDVLAWLAKHRERAIKPQRSPNSDSPKAGKAGRRTKSEEVAARRAATAEALAA